MSTIEDADPPACPACNSSERVRYAASRRDPDGSGLVPEYVCRPCSRAFTRAESEGEP